MRKILFILFLNTLLVSCDLTTPEEYTAEARTLYQNKNYKKAIILLNKAIEKDEKYIDAYIDRAANKSAINDYNGAINDLRKVLLIDSDNTLALFNIGKLYCNLKKYKL